MIRYSSRQRDHGGDVVIEPVLAQRFAELLLTYNAGKS
jgi:hypothetical protein